MQNKKERTKEGEKQSFEDIKNNGNKNIFNKEKNKSQNIPYPHQNNYEKTIKMGHRRTVAQNEIFESSKQPNTLDNETLMKLIKNRVKQKTIDHEKIIEYIRNSIEQIFDKKPLIVFKDDVVKIFSLPKTIRDIIIIKETSIEETTSKDLVFHAILHELQKDNTINNAINCNTISETEIFDIIKDYFKKNNHTIYKDYSFDEKEKKSNVNYYSELNKKIEHDVICLLDKDDTFNDNNFILKCIDGNEKNIDELKESIIEKIICKFKETNYLDQIKKYSNEPNNELYVITKKIFNDSVLKKYKKILKEKEKILNSINKEINDIINQYVRFWFLQKKSELKYDDTNNDKFAIYVFFDEREIKEHEIVEEISNKIVKKYMNKIMQFDNNFSLDEFTKTINDKVTQEYCKLLDKGLKLLNQIFDKINDFYFTNNVRHEIVTIKNVNYLPTFA